MRQGGMKPKSHSSGTYWIRANANTNGKSEIKSAFNSVLIAVILITFFICVIIG